METKLVLVIRDIYGGDGIIRPMDVKSTKLTRTKTSQTTRRDIGVPVESTTDETKGETKVENVNTFEYDTDGNPVLRLGGAHGKLWGTFKEIRTGFYTLGRSEFKSKQVVDMLQVQPVLVSLEVLEPIRTQQLPQKLNGPGNTMIFPYYDVLPKARCTVTLVYPDGIKSQVAEMIKQLKFVSFLNKRRATVESMTVTIKK